MKTPAEPYDFGRYLQQRRRAMEIPLEAVSQRTKIRLVILHQIENEDLKALPTPTITKGFIRAFADAVGVDRDEALKRYYAALNVQTPKVSQESPQRSPWGVLLNLILAILLILALIALSLYFVNLPKRSQITPPEQKPEVSGSPLSSNGDAAAPTPILEAQSVARDIDAQVSSISSAPSDENIEYDSGAPKQEAETVIPEAGSENMAPAPDSLPAASPLPGDSPNSAHDVLKETTGSQATDPEATINKMLLEVTAVELTWLRIAIDDADSREMMMQPGQHRTFKAERGFQLSLGNASGVLLKLNGQPVAVPRRNGKVVRLRLP